MKLENEFGLELMKQIKMDKDVIEISKWAFHFYNSYSRDIDKIFKDDIWDIVLIQEGEEFNLSHEELIKMANKYINYNEIKNI